MSKQGRLFAIKEIINTTSIANQAELLRELRKRKFRVTQATLSRDLRELGISRTISGEKGRYTLQPAAEALALKPVVGAQVLSIVANEAMIVIRTLPGCASIVGEFIDIQQHPDILGTVAGDNTLLVIPASQKRVHAVTAHLKENLIEGHE
jgi:transcriptional regulator of arginine metabolism